jgi:hypothetical protein
LENEVIIKEILKKMKKEKDRINNKVKSELYSINECRNEFDECDKCMELVINVIEDNFGKDYMRKMIKECLID